MHKNIPGKTIKDKASEKSEYQLLLGGMQGSYDQGDSVVLSMFYFLTKVAVMWMLAL